MPAPTDSTNTTSKAGIVTDENGQRYIPSSTRADGSKRKEIKVRPGFTPNEDVKVYRTAQASRSRGKPGVPGAEAKEEEATASGTAASNKNAKRREARKKAKAAAENDDGNDEGKDAAELDIDEKREAYAEAVIQGDGKAATAVNGETATEADEEAEKEKKAKKIRKKLREARDLQQKKDRGEGLLPEQLQKAIRINELIRELDKLGLSAEDETKDS